MLEAEVITELVKGLPGTRDTLILEHMPIARSIAVWYAKKNRRMRDDLIGAANLGLVQAVQWACDGRLHDTNITPYIKSTVHSYCRDAVLQDHTVVVERRAIKKYIDERGVPVSVSVQDDKIIVDTPDKHIIYSELLETFCPRYKLVIELRLAGYKQVEIAEKLKVSQVMVHKYIKEIKEKLETMSNYALQLKDIL